MTDQLPVPERTNILENASPARWDEVLSIGIHVRVEAGTVIIQQGTNCDLFFLVSGSLGIIIRDDDGHCEEVDTVAAGETVGDISFLREGPATATISAWEPSVLFRWDRDRLRALLTPVELLEISDSFHKRTADRLEGSHARAKQQIKSLRSQRQRLSFMASAFTVIVLYITAYTIVLNVVSSYSHENVSLAASALLLAVFGVLTYRGLRTSGIPMEQFGFRLALSWRALRDVFLFSAILALAATAAKVCVIALIPAYASEPLFLVQALSRGESVPIPGLTWAKYLTHIGIYLLIVPIQEIVFRGGLQSALSLVMHGSKRSIDWRSTLLASLIFMSAHMHRSLGLAFLVFVPSIFFGWIFSRHRTLVASSVAHMLVGGYSIFVLGFLHML